MKLKKILKRTADDMNIGITVYNPGTGKELFIGTYRTPHIPERYLEYRVEYVWTDLCHPAAQMLCEPRLMVTLNREGQDGIDEV